ncbi:MAG: hypothetical protein Q7S40_09275 [Opitutaceae bacterium]|nr:hypothetical protein [Opitutaceae bacterium]
MNVFSILRPKYKHPDPAQRAAAVATLTDQLLLSDMVATDDNSTVVTAALHRITDQKIRAQIAKGGGPMNVAALEGINDPHLLSSIARHAASAEVRGLAVARIDDSRTLAAIMAHEPDPSVRQLARLKHRGADPLQLHLKNVLSNLDVAMVAEPTGDAFSGSLDEICTALSSDGRFQIDALVTEPGQHRDAVPAQGETEAMTNPAAAPAPSGWVELLAHHRDGGKNPASPGQSVHFQIKICRRGENQYEWRVSERRVELTNDVASWASSSNT